MLNYSTLSHNRGSIIRHKSFASSFPWCFPSDFIPAERPAGIAPIIGVRGEGNIPFVCAAVSGQHTPPPLKFASKLIPKQHLQQAFVLTNTWLFDHLPLWLNDFSVPEQTVYQLTGQPCTHVDGSSAGLSVLLASLSHLLDLPLSSSWMYSATVSEQGKLGRVNSAVEKAKGIQQFCPTVQHFVLGDYDTETEMVRSTIESMGLTVHVFPTLQEAFQTIPIGPYPSIQSAIEHAMEVWVLKDNETLHRFIDNAFLSSLQGYSQIYGWGSLEAMFIRLKNHDGIWTRLSISYQCKVDSIIMIADRYMNGRNRIKGNPHPPPPVRFGDQHFAWLQSSSASDRLMLLPHLMQQIHERPESIHCTEAILQLTIALLPNPEMEWIPPLHLKLAGSWGRYLKATLGDYEAAYQWQKVCFIQWCNNGFYDQASYPMCALMELSPHLPHYEETIHRMWLDFANKPNARVSQIRRFIPQYWQRKLFPDAGV